MKYFQTIFKFLFILSFIFISSFAFSVEATEENGVRTSFGKDQNGNTFILLEEIPGFTKEKLNNAEYTSGNLLGVYINAMFRTAIYIASAVGVISIVWGGVEYMVGATFTSKSNGRERITNAVIGFIILFGAWIWLNTLNPGLLNLNVAPTPQKADSAGVDTKFNLEIFQAALGIGEGLRNLENPMIFKCENEDGDGESYHSEDEVFVVTQAGVTQTKANCIPIDYEDIPDEEKKEALEAHCSALDTSLTKINDQLTFATKLPEPKSSELKENSYTYAKGMDGWNVNSFEDIESSKIKFFESEEKCEEAISSIWDTLAKLTITERLFVANPDDCVPTETYAYFRTEGIDAVEIIMDNIEEKKLECK